MSEWDTENMFSSATHSIPEVALAPLHTFPIEEEFLWRHEQGTAIEMYNEELSLRIWNDQAPQFRSWVISDIPNLTTSFFKSWLLLVQPPETADAKGFPTTTDRFKVNMVSTVNHSDEEYTLVRLPASRIPNPFESVDGMSDHRCKAYAALKVEVPRSWKNSDREYIEVDLMANFQVAASLSDVAALSLEYNKHQLITIEWDVLSVTFDAELAALRFLTEKKAKGRGPSLKSERAFKMIQNFHACWKDFYNLHQEFPHLKNPMLSVHGVPKQVLSRFRSFNHDHMTSYEGLKRVPNGLYFVNGCPGSGKTEWNMVLAAIIQSKNRQQRGRRRSQILFLVDINKTVDDAAQRYYSLCKESGLDLRIIRMHGFPNEMRQSAKLKGPNASGREDEMPDFTNRFLVVAGLSKQAGLARNPNIVPTLDEASWEYFESNGHHLFPGLHKILKKMNDGEILTTEDWKTLRGFVSRLYRTVLKRADFVATTPVAASQRFSQYFKPDIIFVDEASHARELTTLIPLAYFSPKAWIFTGDVKQTQPFIKDAKKHSKQQQCGMKFNPFALQLKLSTMARADHVNAVNSKLFVNKRAYGNLHRLPSAIFYEGQMRSAYKGAALYPDCVAYMRSYLQNLAMGREMDENRIIVNLLMSQEEKQRDSFWNPLHHRWTLTQVQHLLQDDWFRGIRTPESSGTIMIATPYSTAFRQYHAAVKGWPEKWQERVQVLTVDKAQGTEADVVFLDMVRTQTAGFMDDPRRLNVSITRARQAEIVLMHPAMAYIPTRQGKSIRTNYLSQVWDDTLAHNRIVSL